MHRTKLATWTIGALWERSLSGVTDLDSRARRHAPAHVVHADCALPEFRFGMLRA
jgi:hypothetical protein